jgi:hypothetical protein
MGLVENNMPIGTVQRGYELAPECSTMEELREKLVKEGCTNIDAHLQGSVRSEVKKLLKKGEG